MSDGYWICSSCWSKYRFESSAESCCGTESERVDDGRLYPDGGQTEARLSYDPYRYDLPTGDDLRAMRDRIGLSQRDAAEQAGFGSHRTVGRIENGERYSRETVDQLLELYRELWDDGVDDVDQDELEPIEVIAVPVDVAAKGKPAVAFYLFEQGYAARVVAEALDVAQSTVWQYVNDVRSGRRG
jgi:transcriptional regulator with XRE-family HTH domain